MAQKHFKAAITFNVKEGHPDMKYIKDPAEKLQFSDTYTFNTFHYDNEQQMIAFMKEDLSLVAGGGYSTEHIKNVSFSIKKIGGVTL